MSFSYVNNAIISIFPFLKKAKIDFSSYNSSYDKILSKFINYYVKNEVITGTLNDFETNKSEYTQQKEETTKKIHELKTRIEKLKQEIEDTTTQLNIEKQVNNIYHGLEQSSTYYYNKLKMENKTAIHLKENEAYAQICREFLQSIPKQIAIDLSLDVIELYNEIQIQKGARFLIIPRGYFINNPDVTDKQAVAFAHLFKIVKFYEEHKENYYTNEFNTYEFFARVHIPKNGETSYFVVSSEVETKYVTERCVIPVDFSSVCSYPKDKYYFNLDTSLEIIIDY